MNDPASHTRPGKSLFFALRVFLRVVLCCLLLFLALVISVYLLCLYKPDLVAGAVQHKLSEATGMPWRIKGEIRPVLGPSPGFVITDVSLVAASMEQSYYADAALPLVRVPVLRLYASPVSFLELNPRLERIELIDPVISLAYDTRNRPLWIPPEQGAAKGDEAVPPPSEGAGAEAQSARADLEYAARTICTLPAFALQPVYIKNGSLISYAGDGGLLLSFTGFDGTFEPAGDGGNLTLHSVFSLPEADLTVQFSLFALVGSKGIPAMGAINGRVEMTPPGSRTLAGDFASRFVWSSDGLNVYLPDFRMLAETDAITASLTADLAAVECTGKVQIHKLSLPRWFEFGRVLPPGLRSALDGLIGEFDLRLDRNRAEARNLRGIAGPLAVTGYVGTPDFSAPVVVVDLDVDRADLDLMFPFLAAVGQFVPDPVPPVFDHPHLVPYPGDPAASPPGPDDPPGVDVSYDVKVRVARPRVHSVDGGPLEVLVFPAPLKDADKTRVAFTASALLGGSVDGRLDIDDTSILMRYDAKGLNLAGLPENADNVVKVAGKVTGICEIDVPMSDDGELGDDWALRVDASVKGFEVAGHYASAPWRVFASSAKASGSGKIHAVRSNGIRIEGLWDLAASGLGSSWRPKGNDSLEGVFNGGLFWVPVEDAPRTTKKEVRTIENRGVDKVAGDLQLRGSFAVPVGSLVKPLSGKLRGKLDWRIYEEKISLGDLTFDGLGSFAEGSAKIDFSGKEVSAESDVICKIAPGTLLKAWGALPPGNIQTPKLLNGKTRITASSKKLRFDAIKAELDGAPITGEIYWEGGEAKSKDQEQGMWTFRLSSEQMDLDRYFPPADEPRTGQKAQPSSTAKWDLSGLKGLGLDLQLFLFNAKKDKLNFGQTKITGALQRNRFSLYAESAAFYGGKAICIFQGTLSPEQSQVGLRKGLLQIDNADLSKMLYDFSKDDSYGGTASIIIDATGNLSRDADMPAALSGVWSFNITNGMYPAFLGNEQSTLRNTFALASVSGVLDKGVLRSDNFRLSGTMVDMQGGGWFNLANKEYDMEVSVTFAKVPTVPVRFYGSAHAPRMRVRGVDMVVETVQNAGSTVFGLIKGVLMLPANAISGISDLVESREAAKQPARTAPLAPMKQQTGHPGQ